MTQTSHTLQQDINFLRTLAEAGQNMPLTCGPYLIVAGLVFSGASVLAWAATHNALGLTPHAIVWIFAAAMAVHLGAMWLLSSRLQQHGAASASNRTLKWVWSGLGSCIATVFLAAVILTWKFQNPLAWALFPALVLGLYGAAWQVTALLSRQRWVWCVAMGAFAGALLISALSNQPSVFLAYAGLLLLLSVLPGCILVRKQAAG
ncbi:hypothetical protein [Acetobacter sp.]|uniref:hypothetical protein n=1 Tax=Acetobacter sp. TaxID=440 RepID=UPI0039ECFA6B